MLLPLLIIFTKLTLGTDKFLLYIVLYKKKLYLVRGLHLIAFDPTLNVFFSKDDVEETTSLEWM